MSSLEEAHREFYYLQESLKNIHTKEELEVVESKLEEARHRLWKNDPEFRAMVEENRRQAKIRTDEKKAKYKAEMSEAERRISLAWMKAEEVRREVEKDIGMWNQKHRLNIQTSKEAEKTINDNLICPICHDLDRCNIMNGIPFCFLCNHRLVPKSKLKNYNRKYRRNWKRKTKK